jgi:hypothetical protein
MPLVRKVRTLHAQRKAATQATKAARANYWAAVNEIRELKAQHGLSDKDVCSIASGHFGGKR